MITHFTVKLGLDGLTPVQVLDRGRTHIAALVAHPLIFPTPTPTAVEQTAACDALEAAEIAVTNNGGKQDYLVRNERVKDLRAVLKVFAGYVQAVSNGDPEIIAAAAFETRKQPVPPALPTAPQNLRVRITTLPGVLRARWDGVKEKRIYQLEICSGDPLDEKNFKLLAMTGKNFYDVTGLVSGAPYSFRVNAVGAAGTGPYSDVATQKPI